MPGRWLAPGTNTITNYMQGGEGVVLFARLKWIVYIVLLVFVERENLRFDFKTIFSSLKSNKIELIGHFQGDCVETSHNHLSNTIHRFCSLDSESTEAFLMITNFALLNRLFYVSYSNKNQVHS